MSKLKIVAVILISGLLISSCGAKTQNKTKQNEFENEAVLKKNEEISFDKTLIFQASLDGNIQIVQNALDKGFDTNSVDENKRTALMLAAYNGNTEIVKLLINQGAKVNSTDEIDRTALMYASTGPFVKTVITLLEAGAEPNLIEKEENWTAAMMAAAEGQLDVLKTLIAYGADLDMVDVDGESSLDFASSNGHTAVVEYIKSKD
ncbi:ankyrin repeat domain-containing protein [Prolixibacteraceae bacterium Z1-6]|uniref:Ankyrin repeat domain-containing protein n=1 Tax=Draconibacterium aestuarii TaxID=2998507 RepID=A0A9X3F405_9BACT|nr:ankyrin repeat domain-containing protein [Prolixibacteraceae bacterium Z1-6]